MKEEGHKRYLKQEQGKVRPARRAGKVVPGVRKSTQTHLEEMSEVVKDKMVLRAEVLLALFLAGKQAKSSR